MSDEEPPELLDGETRLIFTHARTGEILHQAWGETAHVPIPRPGERVTLAAADGRLDGDGDQWQIGVRESAVVLVQDVEYTYNYVTFQDEAEDIDAQRLLTDVRIYVEPLQAVEDG